MATIFEKLQQVRGRLEKACGEAGRPVDSVTLLAVTKTFGPLEIREALAAGQTRFGENYVQEALGKMDALQDVQGDIEWHFIGPLQSNKARVVAERFAWVHSVDRLSIAERLSQHRPAHLPPLQVCLQVNIDAEASKSGVAPSDVPSLIDRIISLPSLRLRGLMAVPRERDGRHEQREPFARLRRLLDEAGARGAAMDTLSMGMSGDLEAAIDEGATIVRVGSAIFGARPRPAH